VNSVECIWIEMAAATLRNKEPKVIWHITVVLIFMYNINTFCVCVCVCVRVCVCVCVCRYLLRRQVLSVNRQTPLDTRCGGIWVWLLRVRRHGPSSTLRARDCWALGTTTALIRATRGCRCRLWLHNHCGCVLEWLLCCWRPHRGRGGPMQDIPNRLVVC
jgi:hypothetical protein